MALVVDDHAAGGSLALESDLDGAIGKMTWGFVACAFEGEGVVTPNMAVFLDEEEFVVHVIGR